MPCPECRSEDLRDATLDPREGVEDDIPGKITECEECGNVFDEDGASLNGDRDA